MDANEMRGERATLDLYKKATCCFEQILEATTYKAAVVRLKYLSSHKQFKSDEQNIRSAAEKVRTNL